MRQLIHRICRTIADWGIADGYFSKADGEIFYEELSWLCVNQYGAFNSPVWFNVGLYHQYGIGKTSGGQLVLQPQDRRGRARPRRNTNIRRAARASSSPSRTTWRTSCALAHSEAMLFKYGSGTGTDLVAAAFAARKS